MQFSARQRSGPLEYTRVFYYQAFQVWNSLVFIFRKKKSGWEIEMEMLLSPEQ